MTAPSTIPLMLKHAGSHYEEPAAQVGMAAPRGALAVFAFLVAQHRLAGTEPPIRYLEALAKPPEETADIETPAYVSDNRWVVDCPFCPAAELAHPDDPVYLCYECMNAPVGGQFVKVAWPAPADREQAEKLLLRRPPYNRHYFPQRGETTETLEAENIEHGILV